MGVDAAPAAVISSDGDIIETIEEHSQTAERGDIDSIEGASLIREESTVEKSAMATLAAKEQAELLEQPRSKKGKKKGGS